MCSTKKSANKCVISVVLVILLVFVMLPETSYAANTNLQKSSVIDIKKPGVTTNNNLLNSLITTFRDPIEVETGEYSFFRVGDFNKDGFGDIVTVIVDDTDGQNIIRIFNGNGDGTFSKKQLTVSGDIETALTGDFNGDGADDILVVLKNELDGINTYNYTIIYGKTNKVYSTATEKLLYSGSGTLYCAAADDFNGDLKDDILFVIPVPYPSEDEEAEESSNPLAGMADMLDDIFDSSDPLAPLNGGNYSYTSPVFASYNFYISQGTSSAVLTAPKSYSVPGNDIFYLSGLKTGDFNKDGKADVLISECKDDNCYLKTIFLKADGSFSKTSGYQFSGVQNLFIYDYIKDGKNDLIIPYDNKTLDLQRGLGNGTFQEMSSPGLRYSTNYRNISCGDYNSDGKGDIALIEGDNSVLIQYGNGMGSFATPVKYLLDQAADKVLSYDFNKDGADDLLFNEDQNYEALFVMLSGKTSPVVPATQGTQTGSGQTMLEAAGHDGYISLTWRSESYSSSNLSYNVYRSTNARTEYFRLNDFPVTSKSYTDMTAVNGTEYYYIVKACLQNGSEGTASNEASAMPVLDVTLKRNQQNTLSLSSASTEFTINGKRCKLVNKENNMPTYVNGRLFVPVKHIIEAMGGEYQWNAADQQVKIMIYGKTLTFQANSYKLQEDGEEKEMNVTPILIDDSIASTSSNSTSKPSDRDYLSIPLSYLTSAFDWDVTWNAVPNGYNPYYSVTIKFNLPQDYSNSGIKVE